MDYLEALRGVVEMDTVPENQLQWLMDKSECLTIPEGEKLFEVGQPIDRLFIVVQGSFNIRIEQNGQYRNIGNVKQYELSGLLPYSRATNATGVGIAAKDSCVIALHGKHFTEMICDHHELTTVFVHAMSSRIREFTKRSQQNDKMMALGKLSAGLAHELNNPSAAVVRSSQELAKHLKGTPDKFKSVIKIKMTDEEIDRVNEWMFKKMSSDVKELSMIEKSSIEDDLLDWLDDNEVENSEELAEQFVENGVTVDDLDLIGEDIPTTHLSPVLNWVSQNMTIDKMVSEIEDASQRINDLVGSIKSYTHMDQAPEMQPTDVHVGLKNTMTMLNHKLKHINVETDFEQDLPHPEVLASPINQVWTNLIDNAIDAMSDAEVKHLKISTKRDGDFINVQIQDSGSGIPQDIQDKIFDPFFTTKAVGKGTGLGLEFVQQIVKTQHNGAVYLNSKPGETRFTICLPIESKK